MYEAQMLPMRKYHSIESLYILLIIIMSAHFNIVATGTLLQGRTGQLAARWQLGGWGEEIISYLMSILVHSGDSQLSFINAVGQRCWPTALIKDRLRAAAGEKVRLAILCGCRNPNMW